MASYRLGFATMLHELFEANEGTDGRYLLRILYLGRLLHIEDDDWFGLMQFLYEKFNIRSERDIDYSNAWSLLHPYEENLKQHEEYYYKKVIILSKPIEEVCQGDFLEGKFFTPLTADDEKWKRFLNTAKKLCMPDVLIRHVIVADG